MATDLIPFRNRALFPKAGQSISQALTAEGFPFELLDRCTIHVNGMTVYDLAGYILQEGDIAEIRIYPTGGQNGKQIIASVAMLAVSLVAPFAAGLVLGVAPGAVAAAGVGTQLAFAGLTAGITMLGALAISALIPPPQIGAGSASSSVLSPEAESPTYNLTGQSNQARIYSRVPRLYGRHRMVPNLGATPQIHNYGKTSMVKVLYDFGLGWIELEEIRVGDISIDYIQPQMWLHKNSYVRATDLKYISGSTAYDQLSYKLEQNKPIIITTKSNAKQAFLDISFPRGLVSIDAGAGGAFKTQTAAFRVEYRRAGTNDPWVMVPASAYSGARINAERYTYTSYYDVVDPTSSNTSGRNACWWIYTRPYNESFRKNIGMSLNGGQFYWSGSEYHKNADNVTEITVGGVPYRRGTQMASHTYDGGDKNNTFFAILVPQPLPNSSVAVSENTLQPFTVSVLMNYPQADRWEIRITRTSPVADSSAQRDLYDESVVTLLRSIQSGNLLNLKKRHTMLEVQYTATDKINGVIQNLSAVGHSVLREFNAAGLLNVYTKSANPAQIAIDLMIGEGARYPLKAYEIDWPSFYRLYQICNQWVSYSYPNNMRGQGRRYEWNGIIEGDMTMKEAVNAVLATCRSALTITDEGKYGVLIDEAGKSPRQLITPDNSWGFSGARAFPRLPDAFQVSFVNEEADWTPADIMVYRDGYGPGNTTIVEDLRTYGITQYGEAYRYARYMMAQGITRSEVFTVQMDVENLAVRRGDVVLVAHDAPLHDSSAVRVMSVAGNTLTLDRPVENAATYYMVRRLNGTVASGAITQVLGTIMEVDNGANFEEDALVVVGQQNIQQLEYIITGIRPGGDFTATLTMVKYDEAVYTADTDPLPEWDPNFDIGITRDNPVVIAMNKPSQVWTYNDRIPYALVQATWRITEYAQHYAYAKVELKVGNEQFKYLGLASSGKTYFELDPIRYDDPAVFDNTLTFRVTPYTFMDIEGDYKDYAFRLDRFELIPDPPRGVHLDVRAEELHILWDVSVSPFTQHYEIRYHPDPVSMDWDLAQHLGRVTWDQTEFSCGARTGSYMIRSVGAGGFMSEIVQVRTVIEELPNINVVQILNDDPMWNGNKIAFRNGAMPAYKFIEVILLSGTVIRIDPNYDWSDDVLLQGGGSTLIVQQEDIAVGTLVSTHAPWTEGSASIYEFEMLVDLGDIYEAKVSSLIQSSIYIPGWDPRRDDTDQWNVWLEYRSIDGSFFMDQWADLTVATLPNLIGPGHAWSDWRKLKVGYVTARFLQFRIVAQSYQPNAVIMLHDATIEIDMPDRTWRKRNIAIPAGPLIINFDPAFAAPPVVAVTIEGATTAIRYEAVNLTRGSVEITLRDSSGAAVSGQIDLAALGYGKQRPTSI